MTKKQLNKEVVTLAKLKMFAYINAEQMPTDNEFLKGFHAGLINHNLIQKMWKNAPIEIKEDILKDAETYVLKTFDNKEAEHKTEK